jgi:hypothetical protein
MALTILSLAIKQVVIIAQAQATLSLVVMQVSLHWEAITLVSVEMLVSELMLDTPIVFLVVGQEL